jgi:biotin carboxyl carrier protein
MKKLHLVSGEVDLSETPWILDGDVVRHKVTGRRLPVRLAQLGDNRYQVWLAGQTYTVETVPSGPRRAGGAVAGAAGNQLKATMPGTILSIKAAVGEDVKAGQPLIVMESMKMELTLESPRDGQVADILVQPGQLVEMGALLLKLEG